MSFQSLKELVWQEGACVLSSILFYKNTLTIIMPYKNMLEASLCWCCVIIAIYADDVALFAPSQSVLWQNHAFRISLKVHCLSFNAGLSNFISLLIQSLATVFLRTRSQYPIVTLLAMSVNVQLLWYGYNCGEPERAPHRMYAIFKNPKSTYVTRNMCPGWLYGHRLKRKVFLCAFSCPGYWPL